MPLSAALLQGLNPNSAGDFMQADAQRRAKDAQGMVAMQTAVLQKQAAQDEMASKRRAMAISLLGGLENEPDQAKRSELYARIKPMVEQYDTTLKLPDAYDSGLTRALFYSQISPKDQLAQQIELQKASMMTPYQQAQIDALNERNAIMREKMSAATSGKALPMPAMKDLEGKAKAYEDMTRLSGGFSDGYAGYGSDFLGNTALWLKKRGSDTAETQWWQDYQSYVNQIRNDLFGAALTAQEKAEFEKAIVTPGMNPKQAKANLTRQQAIVQNSLARAGNVYRKGGYNAEQIGEYVPEGVGRVDTTNPALDTQAPKKGGGRIIDFNDLPE